MLAREATMTMSSQQRDAFRSGVGLPALIGLLKLWDSLQRPKP
jgi:hypothetical protein